MIRAASAALLLLAGCERAPPAPAGDGQRLEAAAVAAGLVVDPRTASIAGAWSGGGDRLCVVPRGATTMMGVTIDDGDGQGCAASGTVDRAGDRLRLRFDDCRFDASFDGERIAFPAVMPGACESLCTGRATLAAMAVERESAAVSEAAMLRGPDRRRLCGG